MTPKFYWSKYGGARITPLEGSDWYCQICKNSFSKDISFQEFPLDSTGKDNLKICQICAKIVNKEKIYNWQDLIKNYANVLFSQAYKGERDITISEKVTIKLFEQSKPGDIESEYELMVKFLEELTEDRYDNLTLNQIKLIAEEILLNLSAYLKT